MLLFSAVFNLTFFNNTASAADMCYSVEGYKLDQDYYNQHKTCKYDPILTTPEDITIVTGSTVPTASLSIDGKISVEDKVNSSYGITNYASHTVSVNVTGAESYDLILSGPAKLSGPSTINATAGATGVNLANDTWGYAWENTTVTDTNANYKALGSNIKLTGNALSNQSASFSKKLAFAAKFSEASSAGIYHADVSLSLVATPKVTTTTVTAVPWDKMVYMQDMNSYACESVNIGTSKTLTDIRDNSTYTVAKLSDGKCWMTQNLRLDRANLKVLNKSGYCILYSTDTNIDSNNYCMPSSTTTAFSSATDSNGFFTNQQMRSATDDDYGAYYSYNVATANTAAVQDSGIASQDVCPKGWRLPTGNTSGDFATIYRKYPNIGSGLGWTTSGVNNKAGRWFGASLASEGGAFFPAAGGLSSTGTSSIQSLGTDGTYWSSTINSASRAYILDFSNRYVNLDNAVPRFAGRPIRCIAK